MWKEQKICFPSKVYSHIFSSTCRGQSSLGKTFWNWYLDMALMSTVREDCFHKQVLGPSIHKKTRVSKTLRVAENVSPHFCLSFNLFRCDAYQQGLLKHVPGGLPDWSLSLTTRQSKPINALIAVQIPTQMPHFHNRILANCDSDFAVESYGNSANHMVLITFRWVIRAFVFMYAMHVLTSEVDS